MKKAKSGALSLDELAAGKLPPGILDAIDKMELTVEEMQTWDKSKPRFRVRIVPRSVDIDIRLRLSTTKLVLAAAGILGALWAVIAFTVRNSDILRALLNAG